MLLAQSYAPMGGEAVQDQAGGHHQHHRLRDQGALVDIALIHYEDPQHQSPDTTRAEPADEQSVACRQAAADQRDRDRNHPHHNQRDHRKCGHAPAAVSPGRYEGEPTEQGEHQQFEKLAGCLGNLRRLGRAPLVDDIAA